MFDKLLKNAASFFGKGLPGEKKYNPVEATILKEYNGYRGAGNNKPICYAPLTNMYFGRQGNVVSCCHNRKHIIGTYPEQTIEEIWTGERSNSLRNYLKHNDLSSGCHVCKWDIEQRNFAEVKALHFDTLPVLKRFPTMMEFELDNTCNLECVMCTGEFSSSIRKNREHKPAITGPYNEEFVNQLRPFIPHLSETRFSGGEPFMIDIYFKIWEGIISANPACLISVQTNGTVLNSRIKEIMEQGNFEIGISIDSLNINAYESIRKNARFERVMENTEYFADYCKRKSTGFRISVCAVRENWRELPAYIDFCNKHNASLQIHTVWFPPDLSLWNLDKNTLEEIYTHLSSFDFDGGNFIHERNRAHYKNFVKQVERWSLNATATGIPGNDLTEEAGELKEKLLNKIAEHIMSDAAMLPAAKEKRRDEISGKAENVFARFENDKKMARCFRKMLDVPVEIVVSVIQIENEDRIFEYIVAFANE